LIAVLLLLASTNPPQLVARDAVDLAEVNHFYDEHGCLVFDQQIFYDWTGHRYDVRAWRLIKSPSQIPQRDFAQGGYRTLWMDGERLREVRSSQIRETWTQHDPELAERDILAKEQRRELR
jgi:hypothetical protein